MTGARPQLHPTDADVSEEVEVPLADPADTSVAKEEKIDQPSPVMAGTEPIAMHSAGDQRAALRVIEALLFASTEPLDRAALAEPFPDGEDIDALLETLREEYATRGVTLVCVGGRWSFRTAPDLAYLLEKHAVVERRLSRAALETLSIIAYHQPTTRAEIEEIRGVATSKGTLDVLLETGWVKLRGRRRAPGRPVTYGTSQSFLEHFGLENLGDLPGLAELKGAGLLSSAVPANFQIPVPTDLPELDDDEDPLDDEDDEAEDEDLTGDLFAEPVDAGDDAINVAAGDADPGDADPGDDEPVEDTAP